MICEMVPIDAVQPHPQNPRMGDERALAESIECNGFYGAVLAQRGTGYILAGNHRWKVAKAAGATEIPVIWLDVGDAAALRILLADNRLADIAVYDDAALLELLQSLRGLHGTGYTEADVERLAEMIAGWGDPPEEIERRGSNEGNAVTDTVLQFGDLRVKVPRDRFVEWYKGVTAATGGAKSVMVARLMEQLGL